MSDHILKKNVRAEFLKNADDGDSDCSSGTIGEELKQEKEEPGNALDIDFDPKEVIKYGIYRCVFKAVESSLYIQVKNHETKRTFVNLFSKKVLLTMDLKQESNVIVSLLKTALGGNDSTIAFAIQYGNNEGKGKKKRDKYQAGDSLFVCVDIKKEWHTADHIFQLFEQKRSETDKIYDIIADMKEAQEMHDELFPPAIGVWNRSTKPDANLIGLDTVQMVTQTMGGMAKLSADKKYIEIINQTPSIYEITANCNWSAHDCGAVNDELQIHLNDQVKAAKFAGKTSGIGSLQCILNLKAGDKISFHLSAAHDTTAAYNSFQIQKL